jgi:hypothetical protein
MMSEVGMRPLRGGGTNRDPFFVHFPELRTLLRDTLKGRRGTPLVRFIEDDHFLHNWSTRMRYSHGRDIRQQWIADWATQARRAVDSMGT